MSIDTLLMVPRPWVAAPVFEFMQAALSKVPNPKILEFGSGCSTLFFAQYQPTHLVSVEHSPKWFDFMQDHLKAIELVVDLRLVTNNYFEECHKFPDNYFDFIFIDGKHRMACLQAARRILKSGGVVMLDDSDMTEKYQVVDEIMYDWPKTEASGMKGNPLNPAEPECLVAAAWWVKP